MRPAQPGRNDAAFAGPRRRRLGSEAPTIVRCFFSPSSSSSSHTICTAHSSCASTNCAEAELANKSDSPSGVQHATRALSAPEPVNLIAAPPLLCTTYTSSHSSSATVNAIYVPQGEKTGARAGPGVSVSRRGKPPRLTSTEWRSSSHTNTKRSPCSAGHRKYPFDRAPSDLGIGAATISSASSLDASAGSTRSDDDDRTARRAGRRSVRLFTTPPRG
mmetsp:Transcript_5345/g.21601  ORF Transcript_5345/g.21601 Transcript_5345/m.21601 type:complete len:218 (+) Transcript_5345:473-1126(+)